MKRIAAALALVAGISVVGGNPAGVDAQQLTEVTVAYSFFGIGEENDAITSATNADGQLFDSDGVDQSGLCTKNSPTGGSENASFVIECAGLTPGEDYTIGYDNADDYFVFQVFCDTPQRPGQAEQIDDTEFPAATFTAGGFLDCNVGLTPIPPLFIDKVVDGGPADVSDFPIVISDADGVVAEIVDPSAQPCEFPFFRSGDQAARVVDPSLCGSALLLPGTYFIDEDLPDYGYVGRSVSCVSQINQEARPGSAKPLDTPFEIEHSAPPEEGSSPATLCTITNAYVEQTVTADLVVINDDGGTATADEFTIEVFDMDGVLVDTAVDPDPTEGSDIQTFTLPIGPYTFGVSGPDGYTASAVVTVESLAEREIIGTGADFELREDETVNGVITVDDPPPVPTTSTTAPTTTLAPEPTPTDPPAPTTTISMILPETGGDSGQTGMLLLMGFAALVLGGGAILITRRS